MKTITNPPTWCLRGQTDGLVTLVPSAGDELTVGRRADAQLRINSPTVSGLHAVLFVIDNVLYVKDKGSTNGTFVNGEQVPIGKAEQIESGDLVQFAEEVFQIGIADGNFDAATLAADACDSALAAIQFNKLIDDCAVVPFFQPIIRIEDQSVFGYEVLGRSRLVGLSSPESMFETASKFSMEAELSRLLRREGMKHSVQLPDNAVIFLNTHPVEMTDLKSLQDSLIQLRDDFPESRMILEIHEAAATNCRSIGNLKTFLESVNIGLSYDDFGAGQSRIRELVDVTPDILKFDMSLIKNIHLAPERTQHMIRQLVELSTDLGVLTLAEGVESVYEHRACLDLGFEFAQGFYYGRPAQVRNFIPCDDDTA